jgi:hypothetical protein
MANGNGNGPETTAIHLSLQGKGGVGKSLVASILAQYFLSRGRVVNRIDTDPVNGTFSQYAALAAERLKLLRDGAIDSRGFDDLMDRLLTEDGIFLVDSGASTFVPLWNYILQGNIIEILKAAGKALYVHTVITGVQALGDTLDGFRHTQTTAEQNIIVWINEFFGRVERKGKGFNEMTVFQEHGSRVLGLVGIAKRNQDTFGRDIEEMIMNKETFEEAIGRSDYSIMMKQCLRMIQSDLFEQLDRLALA